MAEYRFFDLLEAVYGGLVWSIDTVGEMYQQNRDNRVGHDLGSAGEDDRHENAREGLDR